MHEAVAIMGATGGIGTALAKRLEDNQQKVFLGGRNKEKLNQLMSQLSAPGETIEEAADFGNVKAWLDSAQDSIGPLTGVVNCVGSILLKPAHLTTEKEWLDTVAVNLTSAMALVRAATTIMMDTGGSIVLVSTAAARTGMVNHEAIAAAKAGVEGLMRAAAATYAGKGIRVNAVAPGLVQTPLSEKITANSTARAASEAMHPLGRLGEPENVASAIAWLLSSEQDWVTGQVVGVDGGLSSLRGRPKI